MVKPKTFKCPHCGAKCRKVYWEGKIKVENEYFSKWNENKQWQLHNCYYHFDGE